MTFPGRQVSSTASYSGSGQITASSRVATVNSSCCWEYSKWTLIHDSELMQFAILVLKHNKAGLMPKGSGQGSYGLEAMRIPETIVSRILMFIIYYAILYYTILQYSILENTILYYKDPDVDVVCY